MHAQSISFIVKTTFDCNMRCTYCYEGHRPKTQRMSLGTTDNLIEKVSRYATDTGTRTSFVWHGGEPLLMGKDFFEHVISKQKDSSASFSPSNLLQTNGILMDHAFTELLARSHFCLGISLDGPPEIHEAQRRTRNGDSSFGLAIKAITEIKKHGLTPGVAATFTRHTLNHLDSFYAFFHDLGLNTKLMPLLIQGNAADTQANNLLVSSQEYGEALIYLFDKWINEPARTFALDPFDNILRRIISGKHTSCSSSGQCHNYFRVFPNGDIYLCGRDNPSKDVLGNINTDTIESILASPKRERYAFDKASLKEICGKCDHFDICHGGCTSSGASVAQSLGMTRDRYCESHKALFAHIKDFLKKSVETRPSVDRRRPECIQ